MTRRRATHLRSASACALYSSFVSFGFCEPPRTQCNVSAGRQEHTHREHTRIATLARTILFLGTSSGVSTSASSACSTIQFTATSAVSVPVWYSARRQRASGKPIS
jgi:hypothetical protein